MSNQVSVPDVKKEARAVRPVALLPLLAPFAILLCGPRVELVQVAVCWSILMIPGVLGVEILLPRSHPFGHWSARPGVASVLALLPFGVLAWLGCLFHWKLTTVLVMFGAVFALVLVVLLTLRPRRNESNLPIEQAGGADPFVEFRSRRSAWLTVIGILLFLAGVTLASPAKSE